jgi:hypothetical protein
VPASRSLQPIKGEREFLDRALALLEDVYRDLCAVVYTHEGEWTQRALESIVAAGIRQLKVARLLVHGGWAPEAASPLRTAWEAAVDVAFILSKTGTDRHTLSKKYMAMQRLRAPHIERVIEKQSRSVRDRHRATIEEFQALQREYKGEVGLDSREHWSGENRGQLRSAAYARWEGFLGPRSNGIAKITKEIIFEAGSTTVHADPGASGAIPRDERGHPMIEPHPDQLTANTLGACVTAILLLAAIQERVSSGRREQVSSLLNAFEELLQRGAAAQAPARRGRRPRSRGRRDRSRGRR